MENKRNFIVLDIFNNLDTNLNFINVDNNFNLNVLKEFCLNWGIVFFKLSNLKKSKNKKIFKEYKKRNFYIIFFEDISKILYFFIKNESYLKDNIRIIKLFYKNSYVDFEIIKKWLYLKKLNTSVYLNLFLKNNMNIIYKLMFLIFFKLLYLLRKIYIPCLNI